MYHLLAPWDFFLLVAYPVLLKIKFQCYPLSGSDTEYFLDTSITATYSYIFLSCLRLDVCDARFAWQLYEYLLINLSLGLFCLQTDDLQDHIIICGFGRVGQVDTYFIWFVAYVTVANIVNFASF